MRNFSWGAGVHEFWGGVRKAPECPGHTHNPDWMLVSQLCLNHLQQKDWQLPTNPAKPNYPLPHFLVFCFFLFFVFSTCTTWNQRSLVVKSNLAQRALTAEEWVGGVAAAQIWHGAWSLVSFPHQNNLEQKTCISINDLERRKFVGGINWEQVILGVKWEESDIPWGPREYFSLTGSLAPRPPLAHTKNENVTCHLIHKT